MGPTTARAFCNPVPPQTPQVCVTGTRSNSLGSRRLEPSLGESGSRYSVQSDGPRLSQDDTDCSRVAQHALVLGSGQSIGVQSDGPGGLHVVEFSVDRGVRV